MIKPTSKRIGNGVYFVQHALGNFRIERCIDGSGWYLSCERDDIGGVYHEETKAEAMRMVGIILTQRRSARDV